MSLKRVTQIKHSDQTPGSKELERGRIGNLSHSG
jgi:hypothetical protein